jgi:ABC-2 type transport system ATP-binding protein
MSAIQARDLVRTYKTSTGIFRKRAVDVQAVRGVSFEVADGELFGLLGPNGAGKTTTIKMLITLLIPTSGSAAVLGYDVVKDAREVRKRIGYVFGGDRGLYERLSALDNLRYFAELYAVPPAEQKRRIAELLDLVGLAGREKERVEGTRAACASDSTSRAACFTTPRSFSLTSRRSAWTRSAPASYGGRSPG